MFRFWLVAGFVVFSGVASQAESNKDMEAAWQIPPIHVTDETGKPLPDSEAAMIMKDKPFMSFGVKHADGNGSIQFAKEDYARAAFASKMPTGKFEVMARAADKTPGTIMLDLPSSAPVTIKLKNGTPVEIHLVSEEGKPVPEDVKPQVYPREYGLALLPSSERETDASSWIKSLGNSKFQAVLAETSEPLRIAIDKPGYLTGFETELETTSTIKAGKAVIRLPRSSRIELGVDIPEEWSAAAKPATFEYSLNRLVDLGGEARMYVSAGKSVTRRGDGDTTVTFSNIAPGKYWASVSEQTSVIGALAQKMALFNGGESVMVAPGETALVPVIYSRFDPEILKGNSTANITVKRLNGSPFANQEVELRYMTPENGYYAMTTGTLDANGQIAFKGLAGKFDGFTEYSLHEGGDWGDQIGAFGFDAGVTSQTFDLTLSPRKGDQAPYIELFDVYSTATISLASLKGQVVFLDFWATWCGPCQEPMAHNQAIMKENGDRWKGKAVIVGASVDEDAETVSKHVKEKGWELVKHLWCGPDNFGSRTANVYGINSVPTALLIDQNGKIVWRGHPSGFDVVTEIDKLLK